MRGMTLLTIMGAVLYFAAPSHADVQTYCAAYGADVAATRLSGQSILTGTVTEPLTEVQRAEAIAAATADCLARFAPQAQTQATAKKVTAAPVAAAGLKPGSDAWKAYCANKYSSFDPAAGTYTGRSGKQRPCLVTRD